jgi:acyl-CoA synthetase (AMP-forming)/AMP-acid ligase II
MLENSLPAPGLRRALSGGAPISNEQLKRWRRAFPETDIQVIYGSTEAEPVAHITLEERLAAPDKPGFCMGRPTGLLRTKIVPICKTAISETMLEGFALDSGAVGELLVSGEHVCRDYYNNPDAVRENKIMGPDNILWHRMGDTGYFDGQDRFWLVGRVHSTMYRDGTAVHPQLLEQAAQAADSGIVRAAAVGLPDAKLGERIIVVVQAVQGETGLADAVRQRLAAAGYPCDEVVVTGKALPLDPRHNSKIEYGQLRAQLLGRK